MNEQTVVRPRDLGALLDGACSLYAEHFAAVAGAVALVVVPAVLAAAWLNLYGGVALIASLAITPAITTLVVADAAAGRRPTVANVWRRLAPVLVPLVATTLIYAVATLVGMILLIVPGIWVATACGFAAQVVVAEDIRYVEALERSCRIVRDHWWRVFGITTLVTLLACVASALVSGGVVLGTLALPDPNGALSAAVEATSDVLVQPVAALVVSLLYWDLRARREGADLTAAIARVAPA